MVSNLRIFLEENTKEMVKEHNTRNNCKDFQQMKNKIFPIDLQFEIQEQTQGKKKKKKKKETTILNIDKDERL